MSFDRVRVVVVAVATCHRSVEARFEICARLLELPYDYGPLMLFGLRVPDAYLAISELQLFINRVVTLDIEHVSHLRYGTSRLQQAGKLCTA